VNGEGSNQKAAEGRGKQAVWYFLKTQKEGPRSRSAILSSGGEHSSRQTFLLSATRGRRDIKESEIGNKREEESGNFNDLRRTPTHEPRTTLRSTTWGSMGIAARRCRFIGRRIIKSFVEGCNKEEIKAEIHILSGQDDSRESGFHLVSRPHADTLRLIRRPEGTCRRD